MAYDYDAQIKRLTKHPERINGEWLAGKGLFRFASDIGEAFQNDITCGCITMIRKDPQRYHVFISGVKNEELTRAIAADERLPKHNHDITPGHLPVFKEWQEKLDQYRR